MTATEKISIEGVDFIIAGKEPKSLLLSSIGYWEYIKFVDRFKGYKLLSLLDKDKVFYISEIKMIDEYTEVFTMCLREFN